MRQATGIDQDRILNADNLFAGVMALTTQPFVIFLGNSLS